MGPDEPSRWPSIGPYMQIWIAIKNWHVQLRPPRLFHVNRWVRPFNSCMGLIEHMQSQNTRDKIPTKNGTVHVLRESDAHDSHPSKSVGHALVMLNLENEAAFWRNQCCLGCSLANYKCPGS